MSLSFRNIKPHRCGYTIHAHIHTHIHVESTDNKYRKCIKLAADIRTELQRSAGSPVPQTTTRVLIARCKVSTVTMISVPTHPTEIHAIATKQQEDQPPQRKRRVRCAFRCYPAIQFKVLYRWIQVYGFFLSGTALLIT